MNKVVNKSASPYPSKRSQLAQNLDTMRIFRKSNPKDTEQQLSDSEAIDLYHSLLKAHIEHVTMTFNVKGMSEEARNEIKTTHEKAVNLVNLRLARTASRKGEKSDFLSKSSEIMKDYKNGTSK